MIAVLNKVQSQVTLLQGDSSHAAVCASVQCVMCRYHIETALFFHCPLSFAPWLHCIDTNIAVLPCYARLVMALLPDQYHVNSIIRVMWPLHARDQQSTWSANASLLSSWCSGTMSWPSWLNQYHTVTIMHVTLPLHARSQQPT